MLEELYNNQEWNLKSMSKKILFYPDFGVKFGMHSVQAL